MNAVCTIIGKEIRDGLRNRWVLATALLLGALALALGLLGSSPTGTVKAEPLTVTVVSLSSLSIFLVPLIAMLLAYDAVVGEVDRGTMALLLSYPLSRWQVLIGKFIGHLAILALATGAGYGSAGLALQWAYGGLDASAWQPFALLIGASVLLGASFLAMGYLISSLVRERATAAGIAVGVWLFFVVIYDMALLGVLAADQGRHVSPGLLNALLLLNPSDVYRLLNLTGFENISLYAGMAGVSDQASLPIAALIAALLLWIAVPFLLATAAFRNKPL